MFNRLPVTALAALVASLHLSVFQEMDSITNKVKLPVPQIDQKTKMWCWAACTQMVLAKVGMTVEQCTQANARLSREDCCDTPTPEACVKGGWPQFYRFGFTSDSMDAALSWEQLKAQIDAGKPVAFSWKWKLQGGHMMVATGYAEPHWIFVNNPWPAQGQEALPEGDHEIITYAEFVSGPNHDHWRDYFNITPPSDIDVTEVSTLGGEQLAGRATEVSVQNRNAQPVGGYKSIQERLVYPEDALRSGKKGRVVVSASINEEGVVTETMIVESSGMPSLDLAARKAIEASKWHPQIRNGQAVPALVQIPIDFDLN